VSGWLGLRNTCSACSSHNCRCRGEDRSTAAARGVADSTNGNGGFPPHTWRRSSERREHACSTSGAGNQEPIGKRSRPPVSSITTLIQIPVHSKNDAYRSAGDSGARNFARAARASGSQPGRHACNLDHQEPAVSTRTAINNLIVMRFSSLFRTDHDGCIRTSCKPSGKLWPFHRGRRCGTRGLSQEQPFFYCYYGQREG
jgi:hypothetical protein